MKKEKQIPAVGYYQCLPINDAKALVDIEIDEPQLGKYDILVEVKACSVNPVDAKLRLKLAPPPGKARILGFDAAGLVVKKGKDVSFFQEGDAVYYSGNLLGQGSNSQLQAIDSRLCALKPKTLDFAQAASLPLTMLTAWESLFEALEINKASKAKPKKANLLIINGAGGVGSAAIQLAKQLSDVHVVATASHEEGRAWCKDLGAHSVLGHGSSLEKNITELGIDGFDYIYCCYATDVYFQPMARLIKPRGKICSIVDAEKAVNINLLKAKSASFHWEFMNTHPALITDAPGEALLHKNILETVAGHVDAGLIKPAILKKFSPIHANTLKQAHALIESQKIRGKLVLEGWA